MAMISFHVPQDLQDRAMRFLSELGVKGKWMGKSRSELYRNIFVAGLETIEDQKKEEEGEDDGQ